MHNTKWVMATAIEPTLPDLINEHGEEGIAQCVEVREVNRFFVVSYYNDGGDLMQAKFDTLQEARNALWRAQ